ncbi:MAG: hypothetical protein QOD47_1768 [Gemmatimonadaceae bacterium]|jgi:hypothetical protein|nr:hypothetical protein [Gemmatimonadaceae bacterium]
MKVLALSIALAGLASTATLNAQVIGNSRVTGTTQGAVNGSWTIVGRDGSGNQIYERRTRDSYGNIVVQRARRDRNGNMTVISNTTVNSNNGGYNNGAYNNGAYNNGNNSCNYSQSTNSVGDIIFGRANANTCQDVYSRDDGAWYQVGQGANNNSVYERRTYDSNGNLVIQRARRNRNGSFTVVSTRAYSSTNDKQWKKAQKQQQKDWQRAQKQQQKQNRDNHR